ncbi:hypothetical protein [uncultured Draconibacterium sp.]|uniref:hypothetical protein n=1 Tax=uncultured Draconibacterium sp. TaxID=1573823 RepID=UPI0025CBC645|nr:hypothetical protein [uncultured Draconibacterium sp.]
MNIFCTDRFKIEFEKLLSKKQYRTLKQDFIKYFFNKKIEELLSGTNLNNSKETPYIKKRLRGSGGYRFYFLILIKEENLYLMFLHPKTGPYGAPNINNESKAMLYKDILEKIKSDELFTVTYTNKELLFTEYAPGKE